MKLVNFRDTYYSVSSCGKVFNNKKNKEMKQRIRSKYLAVALVIEKGKKAVDFPVHRLVAECFIKNKNNKPQVNHIDGNKFNNNYKNLEWCTARENRLHGVKHGLIKIKGKDHPLTGLNINVVKLIEHIARNKLMKQREIAEILNVTDSTISNIVRGKSWQS